MRHLEENEKFNCGDYDPVPCCTSSGSSSGMADTVVEVPPSLSFLPRDAHHVNGPSENAALYDRRDTARRRQTPKQGAEEVENWPLRLRLRKGAVIQESGRRPQKILLKHLLLEEDSCDIGLRGE